MPRPKPLSDLEIAVIRWLRAKPYAQSATAIWSDGMFEGPVDFVRATLGQLAQRRLVTRSGCTRTILWALTDKGTAIDLPEETA